MAKFSRFVLAALLFPFFFSNVSLSESRKIGYILPLSGDAAVFGNEVVRGIELAREELPDESAPTTQRQARGYPMRFDDSRDTARCR